MKILAIFILILITPVSAVIAQTDSQRASKVLAEKLPIADQHNGYYLNPILAGDYGDPTIVLVGETYTIAKSYGDGIIVLNSYDLVNWKPVLRRPFSNGISGVWAVDLQYFNGKYHLYIPVGSHPGKKTGSYTNMVMTAEKPEGPWSDPESLEIQAPEGIHFPAIDPGFVMTPEGKKYLYVSQGYVVELNDAGTKAVGIPQKVYDGWEYPAAWNVQCMCLESPKLFMKDGYYYLVSAEGGTSGPSTAHMTVVARSKSPVGPWENSPYNPLTHTWSPDEKWWQQGHGTIFKATDGSWWTIYHARLNNFEGIGRQVLLMPVEWTSDGWPVTKNSVQPHELIPMPSGENIGHSNVISDNFKSNKPGFQWIVPDKNKTAIQFGNGKLTLQAKGTSRQDWNSLSVRAVNKSYEVIVEVVCPDSTAQAGIEVGNSGIETNGLKTYFSEGPEWRMRDVNELLKQKGRVFMKIKNLRKDISFFYSNDGENWINFGKGLRLADGYNIALFAKGKGIVSFANFKYQGLE